MNTQTYSTAIPCVRYRDAHAALEWLTRAFGFEKKAAYPGPNNTIAHAEMTTGGGGMIMLGSVDKKTEYGKHMVHPDEIGMRATNGIYLVVADADAIYATAKSAGAEMVLDLRDMDYGGKAFTCRDFEGHLWSIGSYDPWQPVA